MKYLPYLLYLAILGICINGIYQGLRAVMYPKSEPLSVIAEAEAKPIQINTKINAYVTGYNTVEAQTDSEPCEAAGGYICGRTDVVACPRQYPLGTRVRIAGKEYECLDRTASKYNDRFDISCDKDFECPYKITGWHEIEILN